MSRVGAPIWAELVTSNPAASTAFYTGLLGWDATEPISEMNDYVTFSLNGKRVAGMVPSERDAWRIYLKTEDATATANAFAHAGGTVQYHDQVADLGTMVIGIDPTGAEVAAWQEGTHHGFEAYGEVGGPVWHELHTSDYPAAIEFYEKAFGWTTAVLGDTDEFRMVTLGEGRDAVSGIYEANDNPFFESSHWQHYFGVADADAAAALIVELGGTLLEPVQDTPYGRMAQAKDPNGTSFSIMETSW